MSTSSLQRSFSGTIVAISLMDLSLSVDNVVAAIALAHDKLWAVYVGVTIGIISLRIIAGYAVKLIQRFPVLEHTAFVLVGYVGLLLLLELQLGTHFDKVVKFGGIVVITLISILWSENAKARALLTPVLRLFLLPMEMFAAITGSLFTLISWPFRKVISLFAKS